MDKNPQKKSIELSVLPDRYQVLEVLGQGGMGIVYKAHDKFLDQTVSIKLLKNRGDFEKNAIRFQREAIALSKLNHKNLATLLDFDTAEENSFYMVYKFVEGTTLKEFVKENDPAPMIKVLKILEQIAGCLAYIHKKGITHRDIKSTNILVNEDEDQISTYILDFGIAKVTEDTFLEEKLTQTGGLIGSPSYMSPEVAKGKNADQRSDIYSFGCVAFELITGRVPFQANSSFDVIQMHADVEAPTLESSCLRDDLIPILSDLIAKSLRKNPDDRPQKIDEISSELNELIEDLSIQESEEEKEDSNPISIRVGRLKAAQYFKPLFASAALLAVFLLVFITNQETKTVKATQSKGLEKMGSIGAALNSSMIPQASETKHTEFIYDNYVKTVKGKPLDVIVAVKGRDDKTIDWSKLKKFKKDIYLRLEGVTLSKDDLKQIVLYPKVTALNFGIQKSMDDDCLKIVSTKKNLVLLQLVATPGVTAEGYKYLKNLKNLTNLAITSSKTGLDELKALKDLQSIELLKIKNDTIFDDTHLDFLSSHLPKLTKLELDSCQKIKGKTLDKTTRWKNLQFLVLANTSVDDYAIQKLVDAESNIQYLDLTGTNITRAGYTKLNQLSRLNTVYISYLKNLSNAEINAFARTMHFKTQKDDKAFKLDNLLDGSDGYETF